MNNKDRKSYLYHNRFKIRLCILTIGMLFITAASAMAAKGGNSGKSGGTPVPLEGDTCMQDIYTLAGNNGTLNCTANDIQLFQASISVIDGDYCDFPGDSATVDLSVKAVLTAQARHDIGIYLALDGNDALHGNCRITTLPYEGDGFVDLDGPTDGVQDTCGDMDEQHNPIDSEIGIVTVQCVDMTGDGLVDLPSCASWRQPGSNELCTEPTDAYPGSPSKCRCEPITLDLLVQPATLQVVKTATPDSVSEPGGEVTFNVDVTNISDYNFEATIDSLTDDIYGDLTDPNNTAISNSTCALPQTLLAGESYSCSFSAQVLGNANQEHINVVTVTGHDANHQLGGSDQETVLITDVPSAISISKTASPTTVSEAGGDVTFNFTIRNDSAVDRVTIDTLIDSVYGDLDGQGTCNMPQVLAAGEAYTCAFSAFVSGNAGFVETNVVRASGVDDDGNAVSATDSASVTVTDIFSTVQLVKTATPEQVTEPGGDVTFNFTVHNPSDLDTITITSLTDSIYGDLDGQGSCSVPQVLTPGSDYACEFTTFVSGNADFVETNVATVNGTDDDGQAVSDSDDATVTVLDVQSAIELIKTATPNQVTEPGGNVTFTIRINNISAVDEVSIDTLTDTIYGDLTTLPDTTCVMPQNIPAGDNYACTFTVFVSGTAGEQEINTATAAGYDDDGQPVSASDSETVSITSNIDDTSVCDLDGDGDVDRDDIDIINANLETIAEPGDPLDVNGDGLITINDVRACILQCTNEYCL